MNRIANSLRELCIDMINNAKSGHIGIALGMTDMLTVIFTEYFNTNDNFILSAGHGSSLLYAINYMRGILSKEDLKNFRSTTLPGHPEYGYGIDMTTGPLGQGVAAGVGYAFADKNNITYIIAGDGCLMEGISLEAIAIAGHYKLNNIKLIWDNNSVTIDGYTSLSRSEDIHSIFKANNWHVEDIDGHNYDEIRKSLSVSSSMPIMISCRTKIGYGSPYESMPEAHSIIMNEEEIIKTKKNLLICNDNKDINIEFPKIPAKIRSKSNVVLGQIDTSVINNKSTREYIKDIIPLLKNREDIICGSADLDKSTFMKSDIHYGTREHAMFGIANGISAAGKLPIVSTFLSFTDYGRPAIRIAAISKLRVIIFATHDSILLGEDGPTHQPIEHIASYRAMPNTLLFRPYDLAEMVSCMKIALQHNGPSIFALSRQKINRKILGSENNSGAYIISDSSNHILDIYASGSEVSIAYEIKLKLESNGIRTRIISCPCLDISNLDFSSKYSVSIEFGSTFGWNHNGLKIGIDSFGISSSEEKIIRHFNLTVDDIYKRVIRYLSSSSMPSHVSDEI